jgi:hypothetical protein
LVLSQNQQFLIGIESLIGGVGLRAEVVGFLIDFILVEVLPALLGRILYAVGHVLLDETWHFCGLTTITAQEGLIAL